MTISDDWLTEGYVEFGIAVFVILLRVFSRTKLLGIRGWQGDDYLILVALVAYCIQAYLWKPLRAASFIHYHDGISQAEVEVLVYSLKVNLGLWTCNVTDLWCLKGCMVFLYARITNGLREHNWIRISGIVILTTWVLSILELYLHCLPLHKLWQITPTPGKVCSSSLTNFSIVGFFNFATDMMLLCVVLPLVYRARLPLARKLVIGVLLGGGVFIIAATLVRNINGLLQINGMGTKDKSSVMKWAVRELLVATLVVNAPCIKPLFSSQSWIKKPSPSEKREPMDWDDAEAQVMNASIAVPVSRIGVFKKPSILNCSRSTLMGSDDLFTYQVDKRVNLKKVRFQESESETISIGMEVPSPVEFESVDMDARGTIIVHPEDPRQGGEYEREIELPPPVMHLRLLTNMQPPKSPRWV